MFKQWLEQMDAKVGPMVDGRIFKIQKDYGLHTNIKYYAEMAIKLNWDMEEYLDWKNEESISMSFHRERTERPLFHCMANNM